MYVCLCNGISDKKIRQAVRQFSPHSFQQLKKFIPVGNQCGKCVRAAREVMEDELMQLPEFKESVDWPPESPDNQYHLNK